MGCVFNIIVHLNREHVEVNMGHFARGGLIARGGLGVTFGNEAVLVSI